MSHELDQTSGGEYRIAYADRETPWHRLGTPMKGLQTLDAMLEAAHADYIVTANRVCVIDEATGEPMRRADGSLVMVDDSRATVRHDRNGDVDALTTVGTRFTISQNREVLTTALEVVGASPTDLVIDVVGVTHGGRRVFATISLDDLVIDPAGINDTIKRYLCVQNGFDGKTPIVIVNSDIRAVCNNTITAAISGAKYKFSARHTRNAAEFTAADAQRVLHISTEWSKSFARMAERMLSVNMPAGSQRIDEVLKVAFPLETAPSDRQVANHQATVSTVRALLAGPTNAGGFGYNGWAVYNAVGEYLDHFRPATPEERALTSMDLNSWVTKTKQRTQAAVLAYA